MSLRLKNILYTVVLFLAVFMVWKYREANKPEMLMFSGKTMGPIVYNVKYFDDKKRNFKPQVDSVLVAFNQALSTYIKDSEISRFNKDSVFEYESPYFLPVLENSKTVFERSLGAFDPTVMPLVNAWGFGPDKNLKRNSSYIDSLKQFVGFDKISFDDNRVGKTDYRVQLDFSASAKGYGVDVVAEYLEDNGITNYFVEIGGEVRVLGINEDADKPWQVGILHPNSDEVNQYPIAVVNLDNRSMATSGNYFNYHIIDGVKYSHTISPFTGYPIEQPLLSASVFAPDCMSADALATAFMVLGHEKAIEILEQYPDYDGYLIYNNEKGEIKTYASPGIRANIKLIE